MTWFPIMAFAVIAAAFALGDYISAKTKGIVSSIIVAIFVFIIFGNGMLKVLPPDLMALSGLAQIIPSFGMALILVNVGTMLDLNDLKREWKTALVAIAGVFGIVALHFTVGTAIFGKEIAYIAIAPTAGGVAATMMLTEAATQAGRPDLASIVAATMAFQMLIGLPISSLALRKEALNFLAAGKHKINDGAAIEKRINFRILPQTPASLNMPPLHLARIAMGGAIAQVITMMTGISTGVTFLLTGAVLGSLGFIEKGSLRTAGGEGLLMLATYASVCASFVSMSFSQFGKMLVPVFCLLIIAAVGIIICSVIVGKLVKWSPWLSIAVGLCCMFGYPVTYAVATEISAGAVKDKGFTPEEDKRLLDHLLPKMLISGVVSVSLASVILAGTIIPMLFK